MPSQASLTRQSCEAALKTIAPSIHRTPLLHSSTIDEPVNASGPLLFKAENLQKGGAFKIRGATYSVSCLSDDELKKGICTHSSGNHAGAVALAARSRSIPAYIIMPSNSAAPKVAACKAYGATVTLCDPDIASREATLARVQSETGAHFIPAYNAIDTMIGQGTCFLELEQQSAEDGWGELEAVVVPVGGGGLLGGTVTAAKGSGVRVFGAEPKGADDCARGIASGERIVKVVPETIADGLRTPVGVLNFPVIQSSVEKILVVSEEEIKSAMKLLWERLKVVVEPSGAVAFAAVRSEEFKKLGIKGPVGIVLSGGNVDLDKPLPWMC